MGNSISDEKLSSSLKENGIKLTREQIQKLQNHDKKTILEIGNAYHRKEGFKETFDLHQRALDQSNVDTQYSMDHMHHDGQLIIPKPRHVFEGYYEKPRNNGFTNKWPMNSVSISVLRSVAYRFEVGEDVSKDIHRAIEYYTEAADIGDSVAQWKLGHIYEKEEQVQDLQLSADWYKKAVDHGNSVAIMPLERLRRKGYLPKDNQDVMSLLEESTEESTNNTEDAFKAKLISFARKNTEKEF